MNGLWIIICMCQKKKKNLKSILDACGTPRLT